MFGGAASCSRNLGFGKLTALEPTLPNESQNSSELTDVEPIAVSRANVDDDATDESEIASMHQFSTTGTRQIGDRLLERIEGTKPATGQT